MVLLSALLESSTTVIAMHYILLKGFKSLNGQVEILDSDSLCFVVKNISRGAIGIRTISKSLLKEYVDYFDKHPDNNADQARKDLAGLTSIDKFEYGYSSTLMTLAKMVLGEELSQQDKLVSSVVPEPTNIFEQPLQLIYYGAPGTGKSFTIDKATNENNSVRTTFHPDSDYASFVGAYKPTMAPMPVNAFVGTTVHHAKNAENEKAYEKKIVYKYVPQAFLKAYVEAWKRYAAGEDNPYYLVIEEINRGNCAQIFGDLFQLLDRNNMGCSSYAISADEDIAQFLREDDKGFGKLTEEQKDAISGFVVVKDSGEEELIGPKILNGLKLLLPPNLRIWATMNTSDQSLFPIDSAFKRRWNWEYMPIEYDPKDKNTDERLAWKFKVGDKIYSWGDFLAYINPKIFKLTMSEDKQMGYFFAKPDKRGSDGRLDIISEKVFVNKVLFYLWTDVFKDYDLTEAPFVYENEGSKTRTAYRFTDFFPIEDYAKLANFVDGFGLKEVNITPLKNVLTIYLPDENKTFSGKNQRQTAIDFISHIGLERIRDKKIYSGSKLLVFSQDDLDRDNTLLTGSHTARKIDGTEYYYNSDFNIDAHIKNLKKIAAELGVKVEIQYS